MTKYGLEGKLHEEHRLIKDGILRDDNPLDQSNEFNDFLIACRHGDLRKCQELINQGVNINGKDKFDYTPLIIYDFSKSSDPFVYWSSHITALMDMETPKTSDIILTSDNRAFKLHKFLLSARSPYFRKKLEAQPDTETWKLATAIPDESFRVVLRYIYLGDVPRDLSSSRNDVSDEAILTGIDKISKQLEIDHLWEAILEGNDRRLARQRYQDEVGRALKQVDDFFQANIIGHKMVVDTDHVDKVTWKHGNSIFADILLRADEPESEEQDGTPTPTDPLLVQSTPGIPIGPADAAPTERGVRKSVLYPAHKAMLIRSDYFERMFSGDFVESRKEDKLRVVTVDCSPAVLELVLAFLYTEMVVCPLEHALELLYAADMLFLDALKAKAAVAISTLGSGRSNALIDRTHGGGGGGGGGGNGDNSASTKQQQQQQQQQSQTPPVEDVEPINIYDVIHAAWDLRVQRLEEFAARYLAGRLEDYIDDAEFQELIRESADRIQKREETDTIELLDDIRYYLSERFRLRFEDAGLDDILQGDGDMAAAAVDDGAEAPSGAVASAPATNGVRTLDGEAAEDEFVSDAVNYQVLLGKIDSMLERLHLDA
ncbi:BTB/POZ domain-containing protein 3 [Beauveria bassiana]|uniref:BTB/POZ domain-containing protein 3 n=1 Tax=Beauveria bassiana TaxID=176275 RepID=A0A2N6NJR6_BEABA|nr:BTB/POZ domain-containing protein 3 [Beauveria bassiana]